jgi:ATP-dependent exoDNAse (exonuclease V) alpha subunit
MLRVNLDVANGLANGSRGVIYEIFSESVGVKFLNGKKYDIILNTKEITDKYATIKRRQIPLVLAFSYTIHKSQGSTLDYVIVNLGPTIFSEGQAYVALSRCSSLQGLFITAFSPYSIMVSTNAINYAKKIKKQWQDEIYEKLPFKLWLLKRRMIKDIVRIIGKFCIMGLQYDCLEKNKTNFL